MSNHCLTIHGGAITTHLFGMSSDAVWIISETMS